MAPKHHSWQASSGTNILKPSDTLGIPSWLLPMLEEIVINILIKVLEGLRSHMADKANQCSISGKEQASTALKEMEYAIRMEMEGLRR